MEEEVGPRSVSYVCATRERVRPDDACMARAGETVKDFEIDRRLRTVPGLTRGTKH